MAGLAFTTCLAFFGACTGQNPSSSENPPSSDDPGQEEKLDGRAYYIDVNNKNVDLLQNDEFTLEVGLYYGLAEINVEKFIFESLNTSIATVTAEGKIKAVGVGTTKIKISVEDYEEATLFVDVSCHADLTLDIAETVIELAKVEKLDYKNQAKLNYTVQWQKETIENAEILLSCSNANVTAELDGSSIVITAKELGTSIVTASYTKDGNTVETNIEVNIVKPVLVTGETYLFSTFGDKTIDISLIEALEEVSCSANDLVDITYEGGSFLFENQSTTEIVLTDTDVLGEWGATTPITLDFADYEVELNLKGYTHVIRTAQDFADMANFLKDTTLQNLNKTGYCKIIEGYYILANDIDFNDYYQANNTTYYASPFGHHPTGSVYSGYTHGWNATFDGNGHQIKNLIIGKTDHNWSNSLFGVINGNKGVIKDVAFVNCGLAEGQNLRGCAFLANYVWGRVENVFMDVSLPTNGTTSQTAVGSYSNYALCVDAKWQVINKVTVVLRSALDSTVVNPDYVVYLNNNTTASTTFENTVLIGGGVEEQIVGGDTAGVQTAQDISTADGTLKVYDSVVTAAKDATLKTNGSVTFETNDDIFTISWNGIPVYTLSTKQQIRLDTQLYSLDDKTIDLSEVEGTISSITRNGENLSYTLDNNGIATVSGDAILNANATMATGEVINVLIETDIGIYTLPLKVCTDVIDTSIEFAEMSKFITTAPSDAAKKIIQGYYILSQDIDFNDYYTANSTTYYASPFIIAAMGSSSGNTAGFVYGWDATFDGNGYQIKNLTLSSGTNAWELSLFGMVAGGDSNNGTNGGVIKNVAFVNAKMMSDNDHQMRNSSFLASYVYGKVENVYIDIDLTTELSYMASAIRVSAAWAVIDNLTVVVRNPISSGTNNTNYVVFAYNGNTNALKSLNNAVLINNGAENQIVNTHATISDIKTANDTVKAYTSIANAATDTTLTKNGSVTFGVVDNVYTIYWNGKVVYEEEIVYELAEQLYSIDDATIDLSKVAGEISAITRDGVGVTYTLDDNGVATISNDTILNGAATTATGAITNLTIQTNVGKYILPLKVCTDVIDSSIEFDEMSKFITTAPSDATKKIIQGYYILSQDIDFNDYYTKNNTTYYVSPFIIATMGSSNSAGFVYGWDATFDGNGCQIKNLTLSAGSNSWELSLFGMVTGGDSNNGTNGGVIKNVAFVNAKMMSDNDHQMRNSAFLASAVYGKVENVYIDIDLTTELSYTASAIRVSATWAVIDNLTVVVRNPISSGTNNTNYVVYANSGDANTFKSLNNAVLINSGAENQIVNTHATISDIKTANDTVKAYTSIANAAADTTLTKNGSVTFGLVDNVYTIYWNGTAVYSYTLN